MSDGALRLAVITGGHGFDVIGFHDLLRTITDGMAKPYVQHLDDLASSSIASLSAYDAALFYFFPQGRPEDGHPEGIHGRPGAAIACLLDAGVGLVVLHHALLAYPDWPLWDEVVGASGRARFSYHPSRELLIRPADPPHPITAGMAPWRMVDETYRMPAPLGRPLLCTDHPDSMPTIGWTRECRASRIVCLQSGHDGQSWSSRQFQATLARSIAWSARRRAQGDGAIAPGLSELGGQEPDAAAPEMPAPAGAKPLA